MNRIELQAYGKINLSLDITGQREDGYHLVKMILQTVDIADTVAIEKTESGITVESPDPRVPKGRENLAFRAAEKILSKYLWKENSGAGVHITIQKRIPMEAGMAGGSADAAAVLYGINKLFDLNLSLSAADALAVQLGADVPFCLRQFLAGADGRNTTYLAEGIGEELTKLDSMPACFAVIVKPPFGISTKWAYDEFDKGKGAEPPLSDLILMGLKNGNPEVICKGLGNVLEGAVRNAHPDISLLKERLLNAGAKGAMMSGSGPTVFGIFTDEKPACDFYSAIRGEKYDCFKIKF